MRVVGCWVVPVVLLVGGCAGPERDERDRTRAVELAPGLRVNADDRWIEFDGAVAMDCHHPETPEVYLEVIACIPGTREHEALVVTPVRPSLIHAGLLAIGLEPGEPGRFVDGRLVGATGDAVAVSIGVRGDTGEMVWSAPSAWIEHAETGAVMPGLSFVFSGSRVVERMGRTVYDADGAGNVVGLATFGDEVVSPAASFSPEASVEAPVWIARPDVVPRIGEAVVVRIAAFEE